MKPRLLILVGLAGGLAVYFAVAQNKPTPKEETAGDTQFMGDEESGLTREEMKIAQTTLDRRELPGTEPTETADIAVTVDVDTSTGKNRLFVNLSEAHGYYVETLRLKIWYKETPDMQLADSPLWFDHYMDRYIKSGETLRDCLEVVPAELALIGGDIGTSDKWEATVSQFGRCRANNPDPLPVLLPNRRCSG